MKKSNNEKLFPKLYKSKENCCGCSACYAICPMSAILMQADEEGFLYPFVEKNKCIHCYQCLAVCQFKKDQTEKGFYRNEE